MQDIIYVYTLFGMILLLGFSVLVDRFLLPTTKAWTKVVTLKSAPFFFLCCYPTTITNPGFWNSVWPNGHPPSALHLGNCWSKHEDRLGIDKMMAGLKWRK
jgi:hypothetical protein